MPSISLPAPLFRPTGRLAAAVLLTAGLLVPPSVADGHQGRDAHKTDTTKTAEKAVAKTASAKSGAPTRAMFGMTWQRNMIDPAASGLPADFDPASGRNVKWSQPVGSQSYAGPVVANGIVVIGTNNEGERNPELKNDRGVVMAFDEETGEFLWQIVHSKLPETKLHDWPLQGVCSTPAIEGDRLWYVSNRAEVVAADLHGLANGNQGEVTDELDQSEHGGDILWSYDMMAELDAFPHNLATSSPIVVGDLVFVSTGNGVDEGHINVPSPLAPSFIALDKNTGELVWENSDPGEGILHGTWTNAAYAEIDGRAQVIFPGGDGWVRAFAPSDGKLLWKFDGNPKDSVWRLGGSGTRNNIISTPVVYDDKVYIGVGQDPEHGEAPGHFYVIDATLSGDVTESGLVWTRGGEDFNRTISTAAIHDGIVYISDLSGFLYALDAKTGAHHWTYDTFAAVWGSPFVADGKVYLGDEDGDIVVLEAGTTQTMLAEPNVGSAVYTTPIANDGVLFVLSRNRLFALEEGATPASTDAAEPQATR
ncbi:MAG: PQQ-binding-like beta-propeller repeat protein [Acidobacteriota bacterium]